MYFVDADRFFVPLLGLSRLDPFVVAPFETVKIEHHRSGLDPVLAKESERIAFQDNLTEAIPQFEFVVGLFNDAWNKNLPDPRLQAFSHRMRPTIPAVEIPYDAYSLCVRRPNGKTHTCMSVDFGQMCAQFFINLVMVPLPIQVHIQFAENGSVRIWIADLEALSGPGSDLQQIVERFRCPG